MKKVQDLTVEGKRVLVRCDFNVPMQDGKILSDFKIKETLPTIQYLLEKQAKVILMTHLDPESTGFVAPEFTVAPITERLSELLGFQVKKTDDCLGQETKEVVEAMKNGEVVLLENLRFHKGEVDNIELFAEHLAELGEVFVQDAFAECHRNYASMVLLPKLLPSAAGLLLQKEIENLGGLLAEPARPFVAIIGGAKVKTKAAFIKKMLQVADNVIIAGLLEQEVVDQHLALEHAEKLVLPKGDFKALDISDETVAIFKDIIKAAKTIIWNGPFGKFEEAEYRRGTKEIANAIIESGAYSVVGGGSTLEFLDEENLSSKFSHVSTGGGAMLAYLSGEELPGIKVLG